MKKMFAALAAVPMLFAPSVVAAQGAQQGSAHDFTFEAIDGKPMPLAAFRGKVLLIVNTASFCGFTKQYNGLQALYQRYGTKGLVVIGVPANDFGDQEPGTNAEIATFCQGAFNVTFPLTSKQVVSGGAAHPFYRWAKAVLGDAAAPKWNFHKYLVGGDGKLIAGFGTRVDPDSPQLVAAIAKQLGH